MLFDLKERETDLERDREGGRWKRKKEKEKRGKFTPSFFSMAGASVEAGGTVDGGAGGAMERVPHSRLLSQASLAIWMGMWMGMWMGIWMGLHVCPARPGACWEGL